MNPLTFDPQGRPNRRGGLLLRADLLAGGYSSLDIDRLIRAGHIRRLQRAVYVTPETQLTPVLRAAAALRAVDEPKVVVSHHTAARLHNIPIATESATEHVTLPLRDRRPHRSTLSVHCRDLEADDICVVDGLAATTPTRTCFDLLFDKDELTALWAAEYAACRGLVTIAELERRVDAMSGTPFVCRARRRVPLIDPRSESPLETAVRLLFVSAKLPTPCVQQPILDASGREIYRLDLAFPEHHVGVEADGRATHEKPDALLADRWRQNHLIGLGWVILRFTWSDVMNRPGYIVSTVRTALDRQRHAA